MDNLWLDLRHALRQLRKSPGFTLTAVLTLAFGIGATTAIFSIVEDVLLRPLPFADPGKLVTLGDHLEGVDDYGDGAPGVTAPGLGTYIRDTHGFSSVGGYTPATYELSGVGVPAQINASRLTAGMIATLGVSPLMGRAFTQQEDEGSAQVAVLSYQMWHGRFHGDAHILGQKILLDRKPYEVIGVMPRDFEFPLVPGLLNRSELWVPISLTQTELIQGVGAWAYYVVGRLKPGLTAAQAPRRFNTALISCFAGAAVLLAVLGIYSVIGFSAAMRTQEMAIRLALGAQRSSVMRLVLISGAKLGLAGCAIGAVVAVFATRLMSSMLFDVDPLDPAVLVLAAIAIFLLALAASVIPARRAASIEPMQALRAE